MAGERARGGAIGKVQHHLEPLILHEAMKVTTSSVFKMNEVGVARSVAISSLAPIS